MSIAAPIGTRSRFEGSVVSQDRAEKVRDPLIWAAGVPGEALDLLWMFIGPIPLPPLQLFLEPVVLHAPFDLVCYLTETGGDGGAPDARFLAAMWMLLDDDKMGLVAGSASKPTAFSAGGRLLAELATPAPCVLNPGIYYMGFACDYTGGTGATFYPLGFPLNQGWFTTIPAFNAVPSSLRISAMTNGPGPLMCGANPAGRKMMGF